jgi:MFS family permease
MIDRKGGVFPLAYLTMVFYSGYDQGVFSGIVGNDDFLEIVHHPSAGILGIIVSIYNLGCFTGTIVSFVTGDRLGPRKSMWFAMVWIIVSPPKEMSLRVT